MADLPIGEAISPPQRKDQFFHIQDTPYGNRELAYRIFVPKHFAVERGLRATTPEIDTQNLKPLGIFRGETRRGSDAWIMLYAIRLTRELSAAHWLRNYALQAAQEVEALNELSPLFADALMTFELEKVPHTQRCIARIDGDKLFFVQTFVPSDAYSDVADQLGLVVASFDLQFASGVSQVEARAFALLDGRMRIQHPSSWRPRPIENLPAGKAALDLYQVDDAGTLTGLMRIKLAEKRLTPSLSVMLQDAFEELTEAGILPQQELSNQRIENEVELYKSGQLIVYSAELREGSSPQEIWIYIFETAAQFNALWLITPARQSNFYAWAVNKRALELVISSIRFNA